MRRKILITDFANSHFTSPHTLSRHGLIHCLWDSLIKLNIIGSVFKRNLFSQASQLGGGEHEQEGNVLSVVQALGSRVQVDLHMILNAVTWVIDGSPRKNGHN